MSEIGYSKERFNILSLDGGGTWALIQVRALQEIYGQQATGWEVLNHFDQVVACSGGSLVAAGLLLDLPLQVIAALFLQQDSRSKIFSRLDWRDLSWYNPLRPFVGGPRYAARRKYSGLEAVLGGIAGNAALGDRPACNLGLPELVELYQKHGNRQRNAKMAVAVVAYDFERNRAHYFRSNLHSRTGSLHRGQTYQPKLFEITHASSNAPVKYFNAPATLANGETYWDGGVTGQNNPVEAGVVEALANDASRESIHVLSIGTGTCRTPYAPPFKKPYPQYLVKAISKLALSILGDPPDIASFKAHMQISTDLPKPGDPLPLMSTRIFRLNPSVHPKNHDGTWYWPAGLEDDCKRLLALDMDALKQADVDLIDRLAQDWLKGKYANQGVRENQSFGCEIGFETAQAAITAWQRPPAARLAA